MAPDLEPLRESYRTGRSIQRTRVNGLPGFVYFDHSFHIHKGIGCSSCHGAVDRMPLTWQAAPLTMEWCRDCHRHPERNVRPNSEVFNMSYTVPANQADLGARLVKEYSINSCSTCHR